jgi:hypothetical protein
MLINTIPFLPDELRIIILRKIVLHAMNSSPSVQLHVDDLKKLILMAESP